MTINVNSIRRQAKIYKIIGCGVIGMGVFTMFFPLIIGWYILLYFLYCAFIGATIIAEGHFITWMGNDLLEQLKEFE